MEWRTCLNILELSILYPQSYTQTSPYKSRLSGFLEAPINLSFQHPILDRCYLGVYPSFHCCHFRIRSRFSRRSQNFFREKVYLKCVHERKHSWFEYFREKFPNTLNPPLHSFLVLFAVIPTVRELKESNTFTTDPQKSECNTSFTLNFWHISPFLSLSPHAVLGL